MSQGYHNSPGAGRQGNGMAVTALIMGLIGLFFAVVTGWIPFVGFFIPLLPVLLAIILGVAGRGRASDGAPHRGLAMAGLMSGIVGLGLTVCFQAFWGVAFGKAGHHAGRSHHVRHHGRDAEKPSAEELENQFELMEQEMLKFDIEIKDDKPDAAAVPSDAHTPDTQKPADAEQPPPVEKPDTL